VTAAARSAATGPARADPVGADLPPYRRDAAAVGHLVPFQVRGYYPRVSAPCAGGT